MWLAQQRVSLKTMAAKGEKQNGIMCFLSLIKVCSSCLCGRTISSSQACYTHFSSPHKTSIVCRWKACRCSPVILRRGSLQFSLRSGRRWEWRLLQTCGGYSVVIGETWIIPTSALSVTDPLQLPVHRSAASGYYVLNPGGDLTGTQGRFESDFAARKGWAGTAGQAPDANDVRLPGVGDGSRVDWSDRSVIVHDLAMPQFFLPPRRQLSTALASRDLYVYCGHGTGRRYFSVRDGMVWC